MKKVLTKILSFTSVCLLMLSACKKNDAIVTATSGTPGTLTATSTTLVLDKTKLTDTTKVISFSFTKADYGYSAAVTNTLQIAKSGTNFATPTSVTLSTNLLRQGYSTTDFNNLLLKLGLTGGLTSTVQARIVQSISTSITPIYSNILTLTVTPFNLTSWLYVVGQFNGYSTTTPDSLISPTSNGIYYGIINFTAGNTRFLVLPAKNYNNKYATATSPPTGTAATATTLTYATQYVTGGGNDLYAPSTAGFYLITLNTATNSITVALTNTYSVIGSSTPGGNYSTDLDLTKYVNDGATGWTGTIPMTAGAFKIRQNHDWTWSWGTIGTPDGVSLTDNSGGNIPVAVAGNYLVSFNILPFAMGTTPANSTPPVTATYKLVKQ